MEKKLVEKILTSNFQKKLILKNETELKNFELLEQEVVKKNKKLLNKFVNSLENYESRFWSVYFSTKNNTIIFKIGEFTMLEIGTGYISVIIDVTFLKVNDYKYLLNTLNEDQKSVFNKNFSNEFFNLYISSEISHYEFDILSTAQNIALSYVFGNTYQEPSKGDNVEILEHLSISKMENKEIDNKEYIDDKFLKLLSGESSTIEYKETMFDEPDKGTLILGHIMFDEVIRCIAGMGNSTTGGYLLVGVHDIEIDELTGLHSVKDDFYKIIKKQFKSEDDFLLKFSTALKKVFELPFIVTLSIDFLEIQQINGIKRFLHITIPAYTQPIFVKLHSELNPLGNQSEKFFVRSINSTENLNIKETIQYLVFRFPNYINAITSEKGE